MLRQRKKERNEKRRHLVAEDEPAIGFFFFFFFFFPSLSLPVEFYPPWAARVGPTSTVIDLTYARSLSFRTSKEKKPRAYRASKCNDDNRSIIIRLSLFFRFPLKTCIIRDEGFPRREKRKICALVEIFVENWGKERRERWWKGRGRWKKAKEGEQRGTCSQSPVHSGIAEGAWKENNAGFPRARLSEASRKQIEILRVATDIQMRFYRGTRYVFDVFGHLFATRLHFLPFDFELDSNYRLLSLNNAILFFHTRVLSTRAVSDHSVEYFSFGSQENPVKSVEITTRWKLVSSRRVSHGTKG